MKLNLMIAAFWISAATVSLPAQTTESAVAAIDEQKKLIEKQTDLLKARQEYLNQLEKAAGTSSITRETSGGATTFARSEQPNLESVSLSYEALQEISGQVDEQLKPKLSRYRGLVIYYEPDFLALARYRLYREQARQAIENYEKVVAQIEAEMKNGSAVNSSLRIRSVRGLGGEALLTGLNVPSIATSAIKSVAELVSLFRTDQTITQSVDVVDRHSFGAVIAGTFLKANPNLTVYHPEQFVPEYDIGSSDETSLYSQLSRVNAAEAYLNYFLDETAKLPETDQNAQPLSRIIASAKIVQAQIRGLSFFGRDNAAQDAQEKNAAAERGGVNEFRQMIRAEKLDRVMKMDGGKTGVIKLRLLSSGGSRRESRNLIFGNKTDYSGSAVIEVALYDADGTLRASEVFSYHTGFRKLKNNTKPRL